MFFLQKTSSIEDESRTLETKVGRPILVCLPSLALLLQSRVEEELLGCYRLTDGRGPRFVRSLARVH